VDIKCKICRSDSKSFLKNLFDDRYGYKGFFDVYKCINCGFIQTEPALKDDELSDLYTNYYPRQNLSSKEVMASINKDSKWKRWFLGINNTTHFYINKKAKVLDIGCGSGVSLLEIKEKGAEAYGIEEDRNVEKVAKELGLNLEIGNIYNSKYLDNFFDYITASQVIEHVPDPIRFIEAIKYKLKNNREVILSFPNANSFFRIIFNSRWINWHIPYHQNFFSRKAIKIMADKTGFKIKKIKTITPTLWTILQIRNLLNNPKEGIADKLWKVDKSDPQTCTDKKYIVLTKSKKIIFKFIKWALFILLGLFDRAIDFIRLGDSFLIILSKV